VLILIIQNSLRLWNCNLKSKKDSVNSGQIDKGIFIEPNNPPGMPSQYDIPPISTPMGMISDRSKPIIDPINSHSTEGKSAEVFQPSIAGNVIGQFDPNFPQHQYYSGMAPQKFVPNTQTLPERPKPEIESSNEFSCIH